MEWGQDASGSADTYTHSDTSTAGELTFEATVKDADDDEVTGSPASATLYVVEASSVDIASGAKVLIKGGGSTTKVSVTTNPVLPQSETLPDVTWQKKVDDGDWADMTETGAEITISGSDSEGAYKFQAKIGEDGTYKTLADTIYVVKAEITGITATEDGHDGPTIELELTPDTVTATAYQWTFTPESGNSSYGPTVNFGSPTAAETDLGKATWYTTISGTCSTSAQREPSYTINCDVSIEGVAFTDVIEGGVEWKIELPKKGGYTVPIKMPNSDMPYNKINEIIFAQDENDYYYVHDMGNCKYGPGNIVVEVEGLFVDKVEAHEYEHLEHAEEIFDNDELYDAVKNLKNKDLNALVADVNEKLISKVLAHAEEWNKQFEDSGKPYYQQPGEIRAFNVSDQVDPKFVYQRSCP